MSSVAYTVILVFILGSGSEQWVGKYSLQRAYDQEQLELSADSTFRLYVKSCTYHYNVKGSWRVDSDTLLLEFEKIKGRKGGWRSYATNGFVDAYSKGVLRGDSLDLRWTHQGDYHPGLALTRQTERVSKRSYR